MRTATRTIDRRTLRAWPRTVTLWGWIATLGMAGNGPAQAAATVEVLETYPAGQQVTLGRNENFYLRLSYGTITRSVSGRGRTSKASPRTQATTAPTATAATVKR